MIGPALPTAWRRLHPLSPLLRFARAAVLLAVLVATQSVPSRRPVSGGVHLLDLLILVLAVAGGVVSWLVTRWRIEGGDVWIETGLVRRRSRRVPLSRLQAVDLVQPLLGRVLGLAALRLRTGGGRSGDALLAYLGHGEAVALRSQLLALRSGVGPLAGAASPVTDAPAPVADRPWVEALGLSVGAPQPPAPPASGPPVDSTGVPARPSVLAVPTGRLLLATAVSGTSLTPVAICVLLALAAGSGVLPRSLVVSLPVFALAAASGVWRRVNGDFGFTLWSVPEGLVVRSGLLQTTLETIPRGRIQSVRLLEPLAWRLFGWCRVDVKVAGSAMKGGEGQGAAEARVVRSLMPVARREEVETALELAAPGALRAGAELRPAPRRARIKAPLSYHFLAAADDGTYVIGRVGRLRRATTIVPLAKAQSVRLVQGPVQRRLGLVTVAVDVPGRFKGTVLRDRDLADGLQTLERLRPASQPGRPGTGGALWPAEGPPPA